MSRAVHNSTEATFPVTVGPDLTYNGGAYDAFVAKVNAAGTALVYCGYIGGAGNDTGDGIAVDGAGNAYVTGSTTSTEATFPVTVGPDLTYNGGIRDAFVAKVNAAGTALVYCGYIGGSGDDFGYGIAVDGAGNAYVTGDTNSTEATFPVTVGPDLTYNGSATTPLWPRYTPHFPPCPVCFRSCWTSKEADGKNQEGSDVPSVPESPGDEKTFRKNCGRPIRSVGEQRGSAAAKTNQGFNNRPIPSR